MSKIKFDLRSGMGDTIGEYLEDLPLEIDADGEGLWAIVAAGRNFRPQGAELALFVRLILTLLLKWGAVPVRYGPDDAELEWVEQEQYGREPRQIVDAIVAEWRASGGGKPKWEHLWFVTREGLAMARRIGD